MDNKQTIDIRIPLDKSPAERLARCKEIANDLLKINLSYIDNIEVRQQARSFLFKANDFYLHGLWWEGQQVLIELTSWLSVKGYS